MTWTNIRKPSVNFNLQLTIKIVFVCVHVKIKVGTKILGKNRIQSMCHLGCLEQRETETLTAAWLKVYRHALSHITGNPQVQQAKLTDSGDPSS